MRATTGRFRAPMAVVTAVVVAACVSSSATPAPGSVVPSPTAELSGAPTTATPATPTVSPSQTETAAPGATPSHTFASAPPSPIASPNGWLEWERFDAPVELWPIGGALAGYVGFGNPECMELDSYCAEVRPYFSADGRDWEAVAVANKAFRHSHVGSVIAYQGGFIATGSTYRMPSLRSEPVEAAIWTSADGRSWSRAAVTNADAGWTVSVCEGAGLFVGGIDAAAAVGTVLVGLGDYLGRGRCVPSTIEPTLWRSSNGTEWERGQLPRKFRNVSGQPLTGGAQFVLAGMDRMWVSADGETWTAVGLPVPEGSFLATVIRHDLGYLAYAVEEQGQWNALASNDGANWSQLGQPASEGINLHSVVAAGDVFVTVHMTAAPPGADGDVFGIVTSGDGVRWSEPQTDPFEGWIVDTIVTNGRSVLVFGRGLYGDDQATWVASID